MDALTRQIAVSALRIGVLIAFALLLIMEILPAILAMQATGI